MFRSLCAVVVVGLAVVVVAAATPAPALVVDVLGCWRWLVGWCLLSGVGCYWLCGVCVIVVRIIGGVVDGSVAVAGAGGDVGAGVGAGADAVGIVVAVGVGVVVGGCC